MSRAPTPFREQLYVSRSHRCLPHSSLSHYRPVQRRQRKLDFDVDGIKIRYLVAKVGHARDIAKEPNLDDPRQHLELGQELFQERVGARVSR